MECSVLVIEDEPSVLSLVTATLHAGGYEDVLTADSIGAARQLWECNHQRFDLVLTDFTLPDGSAPSFIESLLNDKPETQVVLMSGLPEECLDLEPSVSNRIKTLAKPFRPSELLGFLKSVLATSAAR